MGNGGVRLNLIFRKEINGGSLRDKRRSFGRHQGILDLLDPKRLEKKKPERKLNRKRERWGSKPRNP